VLALPQSLIYVTVKAKFIRPKKKNYLCQPYLEAQLTWPLKYKFIWSNKRNSSDLISKTLDFQSVVLLALTYKPSSFDPKSKFTLSNKEPPSPIIHDHHC